MKLVHLAFACVCLLILCSCATDRSADSMVKPTAGHDGLPGDTTMNQDAGRGAWLMVPVRLAGGGELPFVLDTGSPATSLDRSLEPKLGKLVKRGTNLIFGVKQEAGFYAAPALYWGDTPLSKTGYYVDTLDFRRLGPFIGTPPMGILGMDVLSHYCIQLDFSAGKIRFLNDAQADKSTWGKPFPLTRIVGGCFLTRENLTGANGLGSLIDTGHNGDGWLQPQYYRQWTNHFLAPGEGEVRSPDGVLGGEIYPDVNNLQVLDDKLIWSGDVKLRFNGIGLHLLSRNLVTLDFPNQTMYLKRTSKKALPTPAVDAMVDSAGRSAVKYLLSLKRKGRLPGWSKHDSGSLTGRVRFTFYFPDRVKFNDIRKNGDASVYHYEVSRMPKADPWKLDKAWRTDATGRMIEEYPVP